MAIKQREVKMDCECCPDSKNVMCTEHHGMMMCADCVVRESNVTVQLEVAATIDASVQAKGDIFTSPTVALIELHGLIMADATIADDEKTFEYAKRVQARMQHFQQVEFEARKAVLEAANMAKEYQRAVQTTIGKLTATQREHFKSVDFTYQPVTPKTVKPKTVKAVTSANSNNSVAARALLKAECAKYGVDMFGASLMMKTRNMSAAVAARELAILQGKIPADSK